MGKAHGSRKPVVEARIFQAPAAQSALLPQPFYRIDPTCIEQRRGPKRSCGVGFAAKDSVQPVGKRRTNQSTATIGPFKNSAATALPSTAGPCSGICATTRFLHVEMVRKLQTLSCGLILQQNGNITHCNHQQKAYTTSKR